MKRRQLTLFLEKIESKTIESIRKKYNPEQYKLVNSHITLCREDEIENLQVIQNRLENIRVPCFELYMGELKRFSDKKGLLITIKDVEQQFQKLREIVLQPVNSTPKEHKAHITLVHPQNSTCDDLKFQEILKMKIPKKLSISKISLIEQEVGKEWKVLDEYKLKVKTNVNNG